MNFLRGIGIVSGKYNKVFLRTMNQEIVLLRSNFANQCIDEKTKRVQKFKMKQAEFQKEDGLPIFLKRGAKDKLLFNLTLALFALGMGYSFYILNKTQKKYLHT